MFDEFDPMRVVVLGAGEMASGVIFSLYKSGYEIIALEQENPTCIRRHVCFATAICEGRVTVEKVTAISINTPDLVGRIITRKEIPILIDPNAEILNKLAPIILVDARMTKKESDCSIDLAPIVIGLGPGFETGINCHVVIETNRGENLGKIIYDGVAQPATHEPAIVKGVSLRRVLRSPRDGFFSAKRKIGDTVSSGDILGEVNSKPVKCQTGGMIRGLIRDGQIVSRGQKIGDIDPRGERDRCYKISKKATTIAHGVEKAIRMLCSRLSPI